MFIGDGVVGGESIGKRSSRRRVQSQFLTIFSSVTSTAHDETQIQKVDKTLPRSPKSKKDRKGRLMSPKQSPPSSPGPVPLSTTGI
jgi:hypothetical protein